MGMMLSIIPVSRVARFIHVSGNFTYAFCMIFRLKVFYGLSQNTEETRQWYLNVF